MSFSVNVCKKPSTSETQKMNSNKNDRVELFYTSIWNPLFEKKRLFHLSNFHVFYPRFWFSNNSFRPLTYFCMHWIEVFNMYPDYMIWKTIFVELFLRMIMKLYFAGFFLRLAKGNNVLQNLVLRFRGKSVITNSTKINSTVIYSASFNSFRKVRSVRITNRANRFC